MRISLFRFNTHIETKKKSEITMKRSRVIRLVSVESLTNPRITDTPRFPKITKQRSASAELINKSKKRILEFNQPDLRAEFALTGAVYSAWTHGNPAPWIIAKDIPKISSISLHGEATVCRFDQQLRGVMQCRAMKDVDFFCGTSGTLSQLKRPRQNIFHICMVLWSPGFLTAKTGKPVSDSFELELFLKIQKEWDKNRKEHRNRHATTMTNKVEVPILNISLAYVVPRRRTSTNLQHNQAGKSSGGFTNHISKCEPRVLACGVWQLGLRLCLLKPDVVVGIGSDAVRILASISELSPKKIIQNTVETLAPIEQSRAMAYVSQMKIHGLTRKVFSGKASSQLPHYLTHNFDLFRLPHPFTMRGATRGRRQKQNNQDHELQQHVSLGQFSSTMDLIFRFAVQQTQFVKSTEISQPPKRICIRFPPSGGHTTETTTEKKNPILLAIRAAKNAPLEPQLENRVKNYLSENLGSLIKIHDHVEDYEMDEMDERRYNTVRVAVAREKFLLGVYAEPPMRCLTNEDQDDDPISEFE